jgi:UDP-N-acetylmuramyl tripeptide synthase
MKTKITLLLAKTTQRLSRIMGQNGNNIPGFVARKYDSKITKKLALSVENIIFITGTNGKTTTSNAVAHLLKTKVSPLIHNQEGNNLITGVTTAFVDQARWNGMSKSKWAVLEIDEGSLSKVFKEIIPRYLLVTNFFRDQLDRYGEIDLLIEKIKNSVPPGVILILNTDDPLVMRLDALPNPKIYYGMEKEAAYFPPFEVSETKFCPICGTSLVYESVHYGQLGIYDCSCGFSRKKPHYSIENMIDRHSFLECVIEGDVFQFPLKGMYNGYNMLAAYALMRDLQFTNQELKASFKTFQMQNGRMQTFKIDENEHLLNLAKNPAGMNSSLSELKQGAYQQLVLFLNDRELDGKDISWIWDADFEQCKETGITSIVCSGDRAYELAIRLKYAGILNEISVLENYQEAIDFALSKKIPSYFIANYTMLEPARRKLKEVSRHE